MIEFMIEEDPTHFVVNTIMAERILNLNFLERISVTNW